MLGCPHERDDQKATGADTKPSRRTNSDINSRQGFLDCHVINEYRDIIGVMEGLYRENGNYSNIIEGYRKLQQQNCGQQVPFPSLLL